MLNIPIVIAAYNRKAPLERLLASLNNAVYPTAVELIISIDGGAKSNKITELSNQFDWKHGAKQVITSETNMGLRTHILKCGKLAKKYDGIVLLEDDLYVSRYFYTYMIQANEAYHADDNIAGIGLYSHQYNETACLPFRPIEDGYDVFFMQIACSWGQSWLSHQWEAFEVWYGANQSRELGRDPVMPPDVRLWPETSWKKYYIKYIIETKKYFVYPRVSLTTNYADPGVNHTGTNIFQVPLLHGEKQYNFPATSNSIAKYDAYCELIPESLARLTNKLKGYDFVVDLYAMKNKNDIKSKYVITSQVLDINVLNFGRRLKPHELNVCESVPGDDIRMGLTRNMSDYGAFIEYRNELNQDFKNTHSYFYAITEQHYKSTIQKKHITLHVRIFRKIIRILNKLGYK